MSVSRTGRSITFTAASDAYTGVVVLAGLTFQGTGLSAGDRVLVQDTGGSIIADYIVEAATDNADLLNGRVGLVYQGIKISSGTVGGTWVLTIVTE